MAFLISAEQVAAFLEKDKAYDEAAERDKTFIARIQRLVNESASPENIRQRLDLLMREWASYKSEEDDDEE